MATIEKRNGSYRITINHGIGVDGAQIRHRITWTPDPGMSKRQQERELARVTAEFEDKVYNGNITVNGSIRFRDFCEIFMRDHAVKNLKAKTVDDYAKMLVRINQAIGHIKLNELKPGHIASFYSNLQEDGMNLHTKKQLSPVTIRGYHRVLSAVLSKAVKWGYISRNPATGLDLPSISGRQANYLDEDDARQLLILLHEEPIKWRTMITFDLLSGLRRGELLGLRWEDVDFKNQTITIRQTLNYVSGRGTYLDTPKTHKSVRPLRLSRSAFSLLTEYKRWQDGQKAKCGDYWQSDDDRVFTSDDGSAIHPDALTKWFSSFIKANGLPKVTIHSLRHTYASLMIAEGTPLIVVSKQLGHAAPGTTLNIYSHAIASAEVKAAAVLDKFEDVVVSPQSRRKKRIVG